MNERETRELTTPGGHALVVYTYLTAGEARSVRAPYLKQADEYPNDLIKEIGYKAAVYQDVEDRTLRALIVSFDGKKDGEDFDLITALLALPEPEFKFIKDTINNRSEEDEQKKTK
jgi:hypothetical protein